MFVTGVVNPAVQRIVNHVKKAGSGGFRFRFAKERIMKCGVLVFRAYQGSFS